MIDFKKFTNECGIYCFKNKINGKCYIGQAINLKNRLKAHFTAYKKSKNLRYAIYKAINKYGIDNFDLFVVEFVDSNIENVKSVLDSLEKKYIEEYNSFAPNGYNMTKGGDAGILGLKMTGEQKELIRQGALKTAEKYKKYIYAYDIASNISYEHITYVRASELSSVSIPNISKVCSGSYYHPYCKGWVFAIDLDSLQLGINTYNVDIKRSNPNMKNPNSGRFKKGDPRLELLKAQHKLGHKKGFVMSEEQKLKISESNPNRRKIDQLDMNGVLINTFTSAAQIARELNFDPGTIRKVCKRLPNRKSYRGFIWRYHDDNEYVK